MHEGTSRPVVIAGITLGVGLGGFVDGILLHQVLQWHHMLTAAGHPADTVAGLEVNTLADGLFHSATWVATVLGLALLWRAASVPGVRWSALVMIGAVLVGWGAFNLVEALVDHHVLGLHHVRDDLGGPLVWDLGFLALAIAQVALGWWAIRAGSPGR